jgi:ABC-type transport system involved in multi-copper enzyme maturation permease subunit
MTDNIIATERKTNDRKSVAIILSVICFSFCGYYIICHLFFFLWLLYCLSFVFLSVAIILSVICFSFCVYYFVSFVFLSVAIILCHLFFFLCLLYYFIIVTEKEKQMTDNIIATERKTNERQ